MSVQPNPPPRRARALVIDDDWLIRRVVASHLSSIDVTVETAPDGPAGLAAARAAPPDLILLDVDMPHLSGFEVCRRLQADPVTARVPVIFLTGSSTTSDIVLGFQCGAVDYVAKPFHRAELQARVGAVLRTSELVAALARQARTDSLSGLPNRAAFVAALTERIESGHDRYDRPFAVLVVDLDRFRLVNLGRGHRFGDVLLRSICDRIDEVVRGAAAEAERDGDVAARLGGDEFAVLLEAVDGVDEAVAFATRLQRRLAEPHRFGNDEVISTASVGIVVGHHYGRPEDVVRDAGTAMRSAKAKGGDAHAVFDRRMQVAAARRHDLEQDLRRVLDRDELFVEYQPILRLDDGRLTGFEALLRWHHPLHGVVSPLDFISIAEETGDIVAIGAWTLRTACAQLAAWRARSPASAALSINVNVSRRQLFGGHLLETVRDVLDDTGIEPAQLKLEVTESVIAHHGNVVPVLHRLRDLGVGLCVDDFGTGHSSLACLHEFPIDVLKVDRSFISHADARREFAAINQAIATLAHNLGLSVVAEGIETAGQLAQLQAFDFDEGQGYYFARPLPAEAATDFLGGHRVWRATA